MVQGVCVLDACVLGVIVGSSSLCWHGCVHKINQEGGDDLYGVHLEAFEESDLELSITVLLISGDVL